MARTALVLTAIVLTLSACGGATQDSFNTANAANVRNSPNTPNTPNTTCTTVAPPRLVYPPSGATGVATSFKLEVSNPENPGAVFGLPVLTSASSASVTGAPWTAAADSEWISAIADLAPGTTYSVTVTNTLCYQKLAIGSFTTK